MNAVADHRHKRVTNARKLPKAALVSGPIAALATVATVSVGVMAGSPVDHSVLAGGPTSLTDVTVDRDPEISRESSRDQLSARQDTLSAETRRERQMALRATARAIRKADTELWATTDLNIWSEAGDSAKKLGELKAGKKVLVTGREAAGRTEIVLERKSRWVTSGYLSEEKPVAAAAGLSMAPCPDPSVESGLTDGAVYVYRSVCHAFPQITSYGGWDAHGEHSSGRALDIMTSDVELGTAIAEFLQAHASELNIYDIIWRQHIWTPERASEGWRSMPSRGSATADHYDHVHVSVY